MYLEYNYKHYYYILDIIIAINTEFTKSTVVIQVVDLQDN